ncbi:protein Skeletor, isoforms B/C isoform X1 [Diorhabda carinulata]|uniref:protein Skeletor, isoforms B/C isoform X1 n=1 Tax=Diorhabda carinulata TaxID=1163345 RepID=UPI0025A02C4A|nr:protein Skeletor, isoforms B/C isoform X1 [Diorhabda carinulata]
MKNKMAVPWALFLIGIVSAAVENCHGAQYFGKLIGKLSELHHGVSGEVYAVDARTLFIKDFTYDGQGPAAYFYASVHKTADKNGFRLRDETGSGAVIRRYRKEGIALTLPEGKTIHNIKIFYLWCEEFDVNFGDVKIPRNFDYPRPQKIDPLTGVHAVSSDNVVIVDAQTLLIPNFSYDGEAPDAKFWVGKGSRPTPQGYRVPDENGKESPLRKYDRKTIVLTLPGDLTVFDIGHFGVWCEEFTVDFGHILIPQILNIPPSLKMLGISPQSKLNCEVLLDNLAFEVRWAVAGESIVIQLVAKLNDGEYMSFGPSGDENKTEMIGGDVVVAWVDKETLKGYAEDYYLEDKSQCSGPTGSCPDNRLGENTNNINLLNSAMVNGYSIITYQRPLKASDQFDRPIFTNHSQAIIWAIGPLNQRKEVSFHSKYLKQTHLIDFGRPATWNCPMPEVEQPSMTSAPSIFAQQLPQGAEATSAAQEEFYEEPTTTGPKKTNGRRRISQRVTQRPKENNDDSQNSASKTEEQTQATRRRQQQKERPTPSAVKKIVPWVIPPIQCNEPEDGVFYAQMGPTGGKRGYPAITGHVGWGISWYINGLLIPVINVVRGRTYTFVVEGGIDPEIPAKYHPFYITDDPIGGYEYKTPKERKNITIFAGVRKTADGSVEPTGTGRLCNWVATGDLDADDYPSFGAYQRSLELKCDPGEPGFIEWTPNKNTPDTVYYQCFTHRHLGWKINVLDSCDEQSEASEYYSSIVPAPQSFKDKLDSDLESSPSISVGTRVKQINIISKDNEDKDTKSIISEKIIFTTPLPKPSEKLPILNPFPATRYNFYIHQQRPNQNLYYSKPILSTGNNPTTNIFSTTATTTDSRYKISNNMAVSSNNVILIPPPLPVRKTMYRKDINQLKVLNPAGIRYHNTPSVMSHKKVLNYETLIENNVKPFTIKEIIKLDISPQQASTETFLIAAPKTDFEPNSIKTQNSFVPIIRRVIEDRVDKLEPKLECESEKGGKLKPDALQPSPMYSSQLIIKNKVDKRPLIKKKHQIIMKRSRSFDDFEEPIAEANEKIESYYLPPPNAQPVEVIRKPSNIDIDLQESNQMLASPPDVVITYDGKKLSGQSLTAKLSSQPSIISHRLSKASAYVTGRPQFGQFKGELPPLNIDYISKNAPQLRTSAGVLNRELDTPLPSNDEEKAVSTRLSRVESYVK